jgi:hypothetical protein
MKSPFKLSTILFFSIFLIAINLIAFNKFIMPFNWLMWGEIVLIICSVLIFKTHEITKKYNPQFFEKKIFRISMITNLFSMGIVYLACYLNDGTFFEPRAADSVLYHEHGVDLAKMFRNFDFKPGSYLTDSDYSDYGYNVFLGVIYSLFGSFTIIARLFHCLLHALSCMLIFKITSIIFDFKSAKLASILNAFSPHLLFFVGVSLKETLMIFLLLNSTYQSIEIILNQKINLLKLTIFISTILSLFFFRTVLGIVFLVSFSLFYISNMTFKKNIYRIISLLGLLIAFTIVIYYISEIGFTKKIIETIGLSNTQTDAELADKISKGNGSGLSVKIALVIPLLFFSVLVAPFPTIVFLDDQTEIVWLYSGCLLKNLLVFFAIVGVFNALRFVRKKSLLVIGILISYSLVISVAAQSTSIRYQLVSLPFIHIIAAYGIYRFNTKLKSVWFIYLFFIFISIVSWNYFKLSIRGLI